ncbi:MAG: hypothetical protein EAZ55_05335, partial [Cytophagales bacterium]
MKKPILPLLFLLLCCIAQAQEQKPELRVQIGHTGLINQIVLLPDGKSFLTSAYDDNRVIKWDINTGKEVHIFEGGTAGQIILCPSGKSFLTYTSGDENSIKYWSLETDSLIHTFYPGSYSIEEIILLPDSKSFLVRQRPSKNITKHYDLETGKEINDFTKQDIRNILLLPDGKSFFAQNTTFDVVHYDLETGKEINRFYYPYSIYDIKLLPNAKMFLLIEREIMISRDLKTSAKVNHYIGHKALISKIIPLPDGKSFLSCDESGIIKHWDMETGTEIHTFQGHKNRIFKIILLPDGKTFLSGSSDGTINHWNLITGKKIRNFNDKGVCQIIILPDNKSFLSSNHDGTIKHWNLETGKEINTFSVSNGEGLFNQIFILSNDNSFFTLSKDRTKKHFDLEIGKEINLPEFLGYLDRIVPLNDGKLVLEANSIGVAITLWETATGKIIRTFGGMTDAIGEIILLPNGKSYLTHAKLGKTVKHWDLKTSKVIHSFIGHKHYINDIEVLPDGLSFLTASGDATIKHWELNTGKELNTFSGHTNYNLGQIHLLPDNQSFLSSSLDNTVKHWDLNTGKEIRTFKGYSQNIRNIKILPDGKSFFMESMGDATTIQQVELQTGRVMFQIDNVSTNFIKNYNLLFLPDRRSFLSGGVDYLKPSTIHHIDLTNKKIIHAFEISNNVLLLPDGRSIVILGNGNIIHWDFTTSKAIRVFERGFSCISMSSKIQLLPDGQKFLTYCKGDFFLSLWNLNTGKEIYAFQAPKPIKGIQVLPDGKSVLAHFKEDNYGRNNNTAKHWDIETGKELGTFYSRYGGIEDIHLLDDNKRFLTRNSQNSLTLWDLEEKKELCTLIPKAGDNQDYVITTPENYYMATKDAVNDLVHYVVGNKVYLFDQFDIRYNRPDKVLEAIGLAPDSLIQAYRNAYKKRLEKLGFDSLKIQRYVEGDFSMEFNAPNILRGSNDYFYEQTTPTFRLEFDAEDAKYPL